MMSANWKTTAAGVAGILGGLGSLINDVIAGNWVNVPIDVTAIAVGIGLLHAKDAAK